MSANNQKLTVKEDGGGDQASADNASVSGKSKLSEPSVTKITTKLYMIFIGLALIGGWLIRDEEYFTPEEGVGYALGIVGGVMMLLQVLYPMRKNVRFMRAWGSVKNWFGIHMAMGLLGPLLILYHSNYQLHAINSDVALVSMGLVVLSGLIGRFLYIKIHASLYGELMSLRELQDQFGMTRSEMEHEEYITSNAKDRLHQFESKVMQPSRGVMSGLWRLLTLGRRTSLTRSRVLREVKDELTARAAREKWDKEVFRGRYRHEKGVIQDYLTSVRKVVEFNAYRRLFSLWHVLHTPLFIMLIITGVIHVIAVHMY